jgi:hypothetical protein
MRIVTGEAILLLNGDTLPRGKDIAECYRRLMHSDAAKGISKFMIVKDYR